MNSSLMRLTCWLSRNRKVGHVSHIGDNGSEIIVRIACFFSGRWREAVGVDDDLSKAIEKAVDEVEKDVY